MIPKKASHKITGIRVFSLKFLIYITSKERIRLKVMPQTKHLLKMNIHQLSDDHLVASKSLLETRLKTKMQKPAHSSENQQDSILKSYLPPLFFTRFWSLILEAFFYLVAIAVICAHGKIILCKDDDVKSRFHFYSCISTKRGTQLS